MNELRSRLLCDAILLDEPRSNHHQSPYALIERALGLYHRAYWDGVVEKYKAVLMRRPHFLYDLEAVPLNQVHGRRSKGLKTVDIDQICGTQGRAGDFDIHFHPLEDRLRDRWVSVAAARLQGIPLAPVNLIQVGDCCFVQDGHHRISVAHALGEAAIEAEITQWDVSGLLPWESAVSTAKIPTGNSALRAAVGLIHQKSL